MRDSRTHVMIKMLFCHYRPSKYTITDSPYCGSIYQNDSDNLNFSAMLFCYGRNKVPLQHGNEDT